MKIIFLDHDGVICLASEWGRRFKHYEGLAQVFDPFNDKAIKVLNSILIETGAEIVISSDWKYKGTLEQLGEWYQINNVIKKPIDTTVIGDLKIPIGFKFESKYDLEQTRSLEIKQWLSEHPEVTHWVAIDDLNMSNSNFSWGLSNFVLTPRSNEGIKQSGIKDKVLKFLID